MSVASTSESGRHPGRGRGRVVMLVDNAVNGDSRVQKAARSMADAGWDVVLLGQSPDRDRHRWTIGAAEVRLVPVVMTLAKRRRDYRRVVLPASSPTGAAASPSTAGSGSRRGAPICWPAGPPRGGGS